MSFTTIPFVNDLSKWTNYYESKLDEDDVYARIYAIYQTLTDEGQLRFHLGNTIIATTGEKLIDRLLDIVIASRLTVPLKDPRFLVDASSPFEMANNLAERMDITNQQYVWIYLLDEEPLYETNDSDYEPPCRLMYVLRINIDPKYRL